MIKHWISAARPHTLPTSVAPIIIATVYAWQQNQVNWTVFTICTLFALLAQIASNFANDYFDYKNGSDKPDRVGQRRAVASGDIKPQTMLRATLLTLALAAVVGCTLIPVGGIPLLILGAIIVIFALAYSAGPYPLSYHGLGEVTVFIFFGIVPVTATYWLQTGTLSQDVIYGAAAMGLLSSNILLVNNYRDYETDRADNKRTSVVILGRRFAEVAYLLNGVIATAILLPTYTGIIAAIIFMALHITTWQKIRKTKGSALNPYIGKTAKNQMLFTLLYTAVTIINTLN